MNRGQKTLQEYKSINDLLPLHFIIQIFQEFYVICQSQALKLFFYTEIIKSKYPSII